jgi:aminoglycoside phosphotransferase
MKIHPLDKEKMEEFHKVIIPDNILKEIDHDSDFEIKNLTAHHMQRRGRFVLRIKFSNGYSIKLRKFRTEQKLLRVVKSLEILNSEHFPKVLSYKDNWLCLEWINGTTLKDITQDESNLITPHIESIAKFQALMHKETNIGTKREKWSLFIKEIFYYRTIRLARSLILSEPDVKKILKVIDKSNIESSDISITHGDMSAKNIVLKEDGNIASIDNEHLMLHFSDYDFWKTVFYLKLSPGMIERYLEEYRQICDRDSIIKNRVFWQIYNLVKDIYLRKFINAINFQSQLVTLKKLLSSEILPGGQQLCTPSKHLT